MIHNKPTPEQELVAYKISDFYLRKHEHNYENAGNAVSQLNITDIQVKEDKISIYLSRPGLLIGRKGQNIEALQIFLNKPIEIFESFSWNDILVPQPLDPDLYE